MIDSLNLAGPNWRAGIYPGRETFFSFSLGEKEILRIMPITIDILSEASGLTRKCRTHATVDGLSRSIEYETIIPFGNEPVIRRNAEFAANHGRFTVDVEISDTVKLNTISIDPLFLPGEWVESAIIPLCPDGEIRTPEWTTLNDGIIYEAESTWLIFLLRDSDGNVLEIGSGDDLWRWTLKNEFPGASARFKIEKTAGGIMVERSPLRFAEPTPFRCRTFRFKWYFAWRHNIAAAECAMPSPENGDNAAVVSDLRQSDWQESALAICEGTRRRDPCFHASLFRKKVRHWLRAVVAAERESAVMMLNVSPAICHNAAHLERSRKNGLLHWDMMDILDFYLWGGRQLFKTGGTFTVFAAADCPLRDLPSMEGIGKPLSDYLKRDETHE